MDEQGTKQINNATYAWRQGDFVLDSELYFVHLADLSSPITVEAKELAAEKTSAGEALDIDGVASSVVGYVVLTQTCDIVRDCAKRPYIEVAPLVAVSPGVLKEVQRLKRPAFAYVPGAAEKYLVADLDRIVTVEKTLLVQWSRNVGCETPDDRRKFAEALVRQRNRPAFPDDFNASVKPLVEHFGLAQKIKSEESNLLDAIGEMRVSASPSWDAQEVTLVFWFLLDPNESLLTHDKSTYVDSWLGLIKQDGRFSVHGVICTLKDLTAHDYVHSERLDLSALSV